MCPISDFFAAQRRENLDVFGSIGIAYVEPELIEFIRRSVIRCQPYVARLRLAELPTVGLRDERTRKRIGLSVQLATDQLGARRDIAPLIASSHLKFAVLVLIEIHKIVAPTP